MTSKDNVNERLKALSDSTSVPAPFVCLYAAEVADASKVEKALHDAFGVDRPNPRREFFTTAPERIIILLKAHEITDVTPSTRKILDEITEPEDKTAQKRVGAYALRNPWWTFCELGIEPGAKLVHVDDQTIKCTVVDGEQSVQYEGKIFSSLADLLRELGRYGKNTDDAAPKQFTYDGTSLRELRRRRLESEREA
jgi:hypothetical protein